MTNNTIPNVPRELKPVLAMILNALDRDAADGKQAQRIGELEQILRDLVPGCKWRFMRPRIDAALSAGHEPKQCT